MPTPPDASDGGGGLGLPLLLLLVVLVLIVLFFIFKMLTRTPSGPLPAAGGPATDSDTPFTDPMRGGSMPVTSSELEQVPTAPPDLGLTRPVTGTPVTSDELEQIPTVPPDFSQPDGPAGTPIPAGGPVPGGRLDPVGAPIPGGPDSGEEGTDCGPLEKAYREARDACDDAGAEADRIGEEFDKAEKRIEQAEADLADLPSEETRVELPDGTSLSQLDLHLRRQAAGAAWDAYMADPTPETARAAEDAWNEQATPEWLDEQRAAHQAEKDRITDRLDTAKQDKEQAGRDLTEARDRQQEACDEAAAAKRKLDECKKAAEEEARRAAEEAKKAEEEARRAEEEARRAEEERRKREEEAAAAPPPQPVPSTGGDGERSSKCREGATRPRTVAQESFKAFGGSENDSGSVVVRVKMLGKSSGATSDRTISGGMGDDGLSFPPPKEPKGIDSFMQLTAGSLSETVDRLIDAWDGLGTSGQFLYISFEATVAEVWVSCVEEEVCVNGEWKRRHRETKQDWTARSIETEPRLIRRVDGDTKATLTKIILDFKAKLEPYAQGRAQIEEFRRDCLTGSP